MSAGAAAAPVPDVVVGQQLLRARSVAPGTTAGQAGVIAPANMSVNLLNDQLTNLRGKLVCYTCRLRGSQDEYRTYAGVIYDASDKSTAPSVVLLSMSHNNVPGTVPWNEPDKYFYIPDPAYEYIRLVDVSVHYGEAASSAIARLQAENAALRAKQTEGNSGSIATTASALKLFPAESPDVSAWAEEIEDEGRARQLIRDLEVKYTAGLLQLPGGELLADHMMSLKMWIMAASEVNSWWETQMLPLGQRLLDNLRIQKAFVTDKIPRKDIVQHVHKNDKQADPISAAIYACATKKTTTQHVKGKKEIKCFNCKELGHISTNCPKNNGASSSSKGKGGAGGN
jgi:hypothetical protein